MINPYPFPLCIQLNAEVVYSSTFEKLLKELQKRYFYGVELNILEFDNLEIARLQKLLAKSNLKLTAVATGAFANQYGLSLSDLDEENRKLTVELIINKVIPFAAKFGADIICGFIKGKAGQDFLKSKNQMIKSLDELSRNCIKGGGRLYLEATNHYESTVINRLEDGADLKRYGVYILPDTYHMNIEEDDMEEALRKWKGWYCNLHISDNNRCYPGYGAIDFQKIFLTLRDIGYSGTIAIEGKSRYSLEKDIIHCTDYLNRIYNRF